MFPTLFHKQKYLEDSCGNTCKPYPQMVTLMHETYKKQQI